ncbi:MAG: DUF192 domain-containing protein [Spirochaetaceae bacterium]|nr:DUF192 domain-containing protein [Spirochaetaceae bacterium]
MTAKRTICNSVRQPTILSRSALLACAVIFAIGSLVSCSEQSNNSGLPSKPNPQLATVTLKSGSVEVAVEVAKTEDEKNRGLMYRKSLAEGKGMLFVFDSDQKAAFWMKNTSLPLSLAYIASDGTITQILDLVPYSEEPRSSVRSVRYALEVPQGWFVKVGLKEGDKFEIPPLDTASLKK